MICTIPGSSIAAMLPAMAIVCWAAAIDLSYKMQLFVRSVTRPCVPFGGISRVRHGFPTFAKNELSPLIGPQVQKELSKVKTGRIGRIDMTQHEDQFKSKLPIISIEGVKMQSYAD